MGREDGRVEGRLDGSLQIARNLLPLMDDEQTALAKGLTLEQARSVRARNAGGVRPPIPS